MREFMNPMRPVLVLLLAALCGGGVAAPRYEVTALGTLGGASSTARDVNEKGEVVGFSAVPGDDELQHAFLWRDGKMTDLGTAGYEESRAYAVNASGQVAGELFTAGRAPRAFLRTGGGTANLGALGKGKWPDAQRSFAYDVNDRSVVAGAAEDPDGLLRPFLWEKGAMKPLESASGAAYAVNEAGAAAGSITTSSGDMACYWFEGKRTDIGKPGESSVAGDINRAGNVAGVRVLPRKQPSDPLQTRAFLWAGGRLKDLGVLDGDTQSEATSLNDRGEVVGFSRRQVTENGETAWKARAFVWKDGTMTDLNTLIPTNTGWTLTQAWAVNNKGQIAGEGLYKGKTQAFLLTPIRQGDAATR